MKRKVWGQYKKSVLDVLIEIYRLLRVAKYINNINYKILDLGCGYNAELLSLFSSKIKQGVGIDFSVTKKSKGENIILLDGHVDKHINLKDNSFDVITALALIEHVENPSKMLQEAHRLLKKNGILLLTTPEVKSKRLLEFLAFRMGVISKREIKDHKRYYSKKSLTKILINSGFSKEKIEIKTFEMGLNLFVKTMK